MIALKLLVHIFIKGRDSKHSYVRWNPHWYYKCGPQYQELENKCLQATSDPLSMFVNKVLLYTNISIYFYFIFCFFTTQMTMLNTTRTRFIWCLAFDWTTNLCRVPNSLTHNLIQLWRGRQDQQSFASLYRFGNSGKEAHSARLSGILQICMGKSLSWMLWAFQTHRHSLGTGKSPCTRIGTRSDGCWSNTCTAVCILRNP